MGVELAGGVSMCAMPGPPDGDPGVLEATNYSRKTGPVTVSHRMATGASY
jgi:hypothetical protein